MVPLTLTLRVEIKHLIYDAVEPPCIRAAQRNVTSLIKRIFAEATDVTTKPSSNFFDMDAMLSVLEIGRTASYQVELARLARLAILNSHPDELNAKYFSRALLVAFHGCEGSDSLKTDMRSLESDWAAIGCDIQAATQHYAELPEVCVAASGVSKKWKSYFKSRIDCAHEPEKHSY